MNISENSSMETEHFDKKKVSTIWHQNWTDYENIDTFNYA